MHAQNTESLAAQAALAAYFEHPASYSHAANVAALVLERLPNGELAWLKPSTDPAEPDDALYVPTDSGRDLCARWRAEVALFGREVS